MKGRVMRRVYVIYARNVFYDNKFLATAVFVMVVLFFSVSISDVIRNTPKEDFASVSTYMLSSFSNTEPYTKALVSLLALCAIAPLASKAALSLRQSPYLRRPFETRGI
jgi:hypothetical protein